MILRFGDPRIVPIAGIPTRYVMVILDLLAGRGEKLALGDHPDRNLLVHSVHPIRVERLAFGRVGLARRLIDELVDLVGLPAELVCPGRTFGRAGAVPDRGGNSRIATILMPACGEIEIPVAVYGGECARDVELHDFHLDADLAEGLLDEGCEERNVLAIHDRHDLKGKPIAVGTALVTGLVQQRLGFLFVEGVRRLIARVERGRR